MSNPVSDPIIQKPKTEIPGPWQKVGNACVLEGLCLAISIKRNPDSEDPPTGQFAFVDTLEERAGG